MKLIVDVKVSDLTRAVEFYTSTLGLACRVHADEWAGIVVGDAEIHLYTDGGVTGSVEFYVDDIEKRVTEITAKGVEFISGMDKPSAEKFENGITYFPWGRLAYFKDSEGNELALVQDF